MHTADRTRSAAATGGEQSIAWAMLPNASTGRGRVYRGRKQRRAARRTTLSGAEEPPAGAVRDLPSKEKSELNTSNTTSKGHTMVRHVSPG